MVSGRKHTNYFPITETEAYKGYEKKAAGEVSTSPAAA